MSNRIIALLVFAVPHALHAAEISSNGVGGGAWSDPMTWRGKKVPGPVDDVVIQKYDTVAFDRNDDGKVSCRKLQIDPRGLFTFKTGAGKQLCAVGDAVESFGVIKLDGTRSANDSLELRLLGDTADKRKIKLGKGGGLLLYGKDNLPDGRRNVALTSPKTAEQKEDLLSIVECNGAVSIDWQRADVLNVKLMAKKIDNTGAKSNERINLIENRFTGFSRVWIHTCDTPVIARNSFEFASPKPLDEPAINLNFCPLAEIKANTIRGGFQIGVTVNYQSDSVIVGNTIEKCTFAITGGYGIPNTMIRQCTIRACETGIKLEGASGVIENTDVEGATTAFHIQNANLQLTSFRVKNLAPKGNAVLFDSGAMTLLNCNIAADQIKIAPQAATVKTDLVTCLHHVIVAVKDAPADCLVEVRTSNLPADTGDPNVRNTPAPLPQGLTPSPKTFNPLIVKAWSIDVKGKLQGAPEYTVKVLGPAAKEGEARPVLKMTTFRPDAATPTLEVKLK